MTDGTRTTKSIAAFAASVGTGRRREENKRENPTSRQTTPWWHGAFSVLATAAIFYVPLLAPACAPLAQEREGGSTASADSALYVGKAAFKEHRYLEARAAARNLLQRRPNNGGALRLLGWSEYQLGNYQPALDAFGQAASVENNVDAMIGLGWANFKLGALDKAEAYLRSAQSNAQGDQRYIVADGLGWVSYVKDDFARAAHFFRAEPESRQAGRAFEDGNLGLGWIALSRGNLAAARSQFQIGLRRQPDYFRLHDGLGRVALFAGKYDAALRSVLNGFRLIRYNRELVLLLDAVLRKIANPARSVQVYQDLSRRYPDIPVFHNGRAWSELALGRLHEAKAGFLTALKMLPEYRLARIGLERTVARMNAVVVDGWSHYEKGNFAMALAAFNAKRGNATKNAAINTGRGWSLLAMGKFVKAERAFRAAVDVDPDFTSAQDGLAALRHGPETVYLKAWDLIEARRFTRAREQFNRAKAVLPPDQAWRAEEGLAWADIFDGRAQEAARVFERILAVRPDAYLSRKGMGYAAIERGAYEDAVSHLEASFAMEPDQVLTSFTVPAKRLIVAKRYDLAIRVLESGARVHRESADIEFLMARAKIGLGDKVGAVQHAEQAAKLSPVAINAVFESLGIRGREMRQAYLAMARGLYASGNSEAALRRFNEYVGVGGTDPAALRDRGFALYRLGRFREALDDLGRAAKHEPQRLAPVTSIVTIPGTRERWEITYNGRSTLAWSHLLIGDSKRAAAEFRKVLETYPGWIDAQTGLGYSLLALGKKRGAVRHFREALLLSPGYPNAWQGMSRAGALR